MALAFAAGAAAQQFPSKPVTLICPWPPGGSTDINLRALAEATGKYLGQPVIVENKPGAQGGIAAGEVARAAPDGYTLMVGTNTPLAANPSLFRKLSYDPAKDFAPVARLTKKSGCRTALWSERRGPIDAAVEVLIGDTMGELQLFYGAADVAFIGGSLVPTGGHNLLEAAAVGVPHEHRHAEVGRLDDGAAAAAHGFERGRDVVDRERQRGRAGDEPPAVGAAVEREPLTATSTSPPSRSSVARKLSSVRRVSICAVRQETRVTSRPDGLVSSFSTYALVISDTLARWSAGSTHTTWASDFPCTRHGKPSQVSHRRQRLPCRSCSSSITPSGT